MCLKRNFKKKWEASGILYRRGKALVMLPIKTNYYKIRRENSITDGPFEPGECNETDERKAFKAGNRLFKMMQKEAKAEAKKTAEQMKSF